jgi:hypothetical protein
VNDGRGNPIAGAVISLNSEQSFSDITNEAGEFSIISGTAVSRSHVAGAGSNIVYGIGTTYRQLYFQLNTLIENGAASIFTGTGKCIWTTRVASRKGGFHTYQLPRLSSGIYLLIHCPINTAEPMRRHKPIWRRNGV